jgi:hypothetical protein
MKRILQLLMLLITSTSYSQDVGPYKYLKKENGAVFFERVYDMDSVSAQEVESFLTANLPSIRDFSDFVKTPDVITGKVKDCLVDYKRYGGKWGNTLALLNHPMFANVSIVWKDNKYRVTVNNIYFMTAGLGKMKLDEVVTKRRGTEFDPNRTVVSGGIYVEKYLSELFEIEKSKKADW